MPPDKYQTYESPLVSRNASPEMVRLFSPEHRVGLWRKLWIALAEAQHELGLPITTRQITALKKAAPRIDFARAAEHEKRLRHDVMAQVHTFGDAAPIARGILHLGATSADITDNADLLILRDALTLIRNWLANVIDAFGRFAQQYRRLPILGFTHFQPAQLTTVGKRATLWCYDFVMDLQRVEQELAALEFRGLKGATGTQNSFLELFSQGVEGFSLRGAEARVRRLEKRFTHKMGFEKIAPVTGQTYSRKVDAQVIGLLAGVAVSAHKFCNDLRLLAHRREMEEPFERDQIGSSAMPYKRNPMRCERATGLARFVISLANSPLQTAAEQWLERTLDDSANRRLTLPETFLATDGILRIVTNVARGLVVNKAIVAANVRQELPFLASENLLMHAARAGGDRQQLHEKLRRLTHTAAQQIKNGETPDLWNTLRDDPEFGKINLSKLLNPAAHVGLAPQQTADFLRQFVTPIRRRYRTLLSANASLEV
ncbi:MAG: Adenylosuccinate lyase [Phycisphaerae bacterium]|nr:Adenylosuccinate lyase [Phycisphaerae bacterium]